MDQALYHLLLKDKEQNIACLGFFFNYPIDEYFIENDSALIFGRSDHLWAHISSTSKSDLEKLLTNHNRKTKYYFSVEDWMLPSIYEHGESEWIMTTNRYILRNNIDFEEPDTVIKQLDISSAAYIYQNSDYKKFTSLQYIQDRLNRDISAGIWSNNRLVAWGFTHDDGALGFLHVLNDFRRNGFGVQIIRHLIKKRVDEEKPVFVNIVPNNIVAIKLVSKLGFTFDRKVSWVKLK